MKFELHVFGFGTLACNNSKIRMCVRLCELETFGCVLVVFYSVFTL
jgi:hypothetical protein